MTFEHVFYVFSKCTAYLVFNNIFGHSLHINFFDFMFKHVFNTLCLLKNKCKKGDLYEFTLLYLRIPLFTVNNFNLNFTTKYTTLNQLFVFILLT